MPRASQSGLTLVELLVVIAIISVLAALFFPALNTAKSRARRIQCVSNQHQLGIALNTFLTDNHTYPLWAAPTNNDPPGHWWAEQLQRAALGATRADPNFIQHGVWRCPSSALPRPDSVSYGYNAFGSLGIGNVTNNLGLLGHYSESSESLTPIREAEVVNSAGMIAVGESDVVTFMRASKYDLVGGSARHQGKITVLFCDGHVEGLKPTILFEETSDVALALWNRDHMAHRDRL